MKLLLPALALLLASCDKPADVSHLDAAPVLRENAELKKKVAALEKEKAEISAELYRSRKLYELATREVAKEWIEKDKLKRAAATESN